MSLIQFVSLLLILFEIYEIRTCSPPYLTIANGCYKIVNGSRLTWSQARESCENDTSFANGTHFQGFSHLVAIENYMERNSLMTYLSANGIGSEFWIDGIVGISKWSWSNNSIEWFFERDERNITGDGSYYKLVAGNSSRGYIISDENANQTLSYICEYQVQCNFQRNRNCTDKGICYTNVGLDVCACSRGYTGDLCEIDINDCLSSPCLHGGNCTDGMNNYTCDCSNTFYEGVNCEILKSDPKESNRQAAFWSVLGVVIGLIVLLTLSDLPWSDIFTSIGCSCSRITCCIKENHSQNQKNNNHFPFIDSPTNNPKTNIKIMRKSFESTDHQTSPINIQYNGYHSPDSNLILQKSQIKTNAPIHTIEPQSNNKHSVDSMVNWTQQLQEQLKTKNARENSASSTKQLIHSTDSYHY